MGWLFRNTDPGFMISDPKNIFGEVFEAKNVIKKKNYQIIIIGYFFLVRFSAVLVVGLADLKGLKVFPTATHIGLMF